MSVLDTQITESAFEAYSSRVPQSGPPWLLTLRQAAMERFNQLGFPDARHEAWRFLNITSMVRTKFAAPAADPLLPSPSIEPFSFGPMDRSVLVFFNGRFQASASNTEALPQGVQVMDLAEACETQGKLVKGHLAKHAPFEDEAFTALNTAMFEQGLLVHVPRGVSVESPIHILNIVSPTERPVMLSPRVLVIAEDGSRVSVVEDFVAPEDGVYLTNAVTEFVVGEEAVACHYLLERESEAAFNVSTLAICQQRASQFTSHSVLTGGAIVRNNVYAVLAGEGCDSLLNGLYVLAGNQAIDNHMRVEHAAPHCDSRQFYKGIMSDQSHGLFRGRIVVQSGAQQTDAKQSNQNLLLSDQAMANSDPQLEIYADDVKCTHGSTTGQVDRKAMFYLQARGIPEQTARAMLVYAFARVSLGRMGIEPIREHFKNEILRRLPFGETLRQVI